MLAANFPFLILRSSSPARRSSQASPIAPIFVSLIFTGNSEETPDYGNQEDLSKLGAEAFAFVNVARFAVPLRISLALGTTPWVKENVVDKFGLGKKGEAKAEE